MKAFQARRRTSRPRAWNYSILLALEARSDFTGEPVVQLLWALGRIVDVYRHGHRWGEPTSNVSVSIARYEERRR